MHNFIPYLVVEEQVEAQSKGEHEDEKDDNEREEGFEHIVEDDDVLADHGELPHVGEQVQPGSRQQDRSQLVHRALYSNHCRGGE